MTDKEAIAAIRTLEMSGYTYHGGDLWKPPVGKRPAWLDDPTPEIRVAELSLTRSNQEDREIAFRLRLGTGRMVTLTMPPYEFALLVTGMSDVPVKVTTRNVELVIAPRSKHEQVMLDRIAAAQAPRDEDE